MYIKFAFNYSNLKTAKKVLDRASGGAMLMYITLISAGLIGVFDKSGIMEKMGVLILNFVPDYLGNYFLYRFLFYGVMECN
ncbi:Uncharacterised protein [Campylobacter jejuni]|nr:citrate-Mg2+:H+ or citrate-Ca2+:H+ symporter, CitMHS family [Campylobacter jejuni subsp. doylei]VTX52341.1 Uncharacterised protein [Campylobacter jejuni]